MHLIYLGGKIVQKIDLSKKSFNTIGRLVECDIKLDHPSLSRFHAVMQYGSPKVKDNNIIK